MQGTRPSLPEPKRGRASSKKVRTGCITCKARHVKCDETKPGCNRCTKFGRECDGYANDPPESKKQNIFPTLSQVGLVQGSSTTSLPTKAHPADSYFAYEPSSSMFRSVRIESPPLAKTRCLTCKESRAKCDQKKPTCFRCKKRGRPCVYPYDELPQPQNQMPEDGISPPRNETPEQSICDSIDTFDGLLLPPVMAQSGFPDINTMNVLQHGNQVSQYPDACLDPNLAGDLNMEMWPQFVTTEPSAEAGAGVLDMWGNCMTWENHQQHSYQ